jgi:hypothetical protein
MRALPLLIGLVGCAARPPVDTGEGGRGSGCALPELDALPEAADPPALLRTWCGGRPVESAADWWDTRRPEAQMLLEHYVYGVGAAVGGAPGEAVTRASLQSGATLVEVDLDVGADVAPIRLTLFLPPDVPSPPVVLALNACGAHTLTGNWVESDCPPADESGRGGRAETWPVTASS